jgi:hypothetical protein
VGDWDLQALHTTGAEPWALKAEPHAFNRAGLSLSVSPGAQALELEHLGRRLGRLRLQDGWTCLGWVQPGRPFPFAAPEHSWLFQGPSGQRALLTVSAWAMQRESRDLGLRWEPLGVPAKDFEFSFEPEGDGDWLLPINQGLRVPSKGPHVDPGYPLDLRAGHALSLPAIGWQQGEESLLVLSERPADQALRLKLKQKQLSWTLRPSQGAWLGTDDPMS